MSFPAWLLFVSLAYTQDISPLDKMKPRPLLCFLSRHSTTLKKKFFNHFNFLTFFKLLFISFNSCIFMSLFLVNTINQYKLSYTAAKMPGYFSLIILGLAWSSRRLYFSQRFRNKSNRGSPLLNCPSFRTSLQDLPQQSKKRKRELCKAKSNLLRPCYWLDMATGLHLTA